MKTVFRGIVLLTLVGTLLGGSGAYARQEGTGSSVVLQHRTPVVKLAPEVAATDKVTLELRNKQEDAAHKFISGGSSSSVFKPAPGAVKFLEGKKSLRTPATGAWSVLLTPAKSKTTNAFLEFTLPDVLSRTEVSFLQKRPSMLGSPDGFFWPDSFAHFGFLAKKDHAYLITVVAKKTSRPEDNFVLFPVSDATGGGPIYAQPTQLLPLDLGIQDFTVEHIVLVSKAGWYGFRTALQGAGSWDLSSVSIQEIVSPTP